MAKTNTGFTTLVNGVQTDLINIFDTLTGTKLTYNTNYVTSAGLDLTDIFEPYLEGDATADPTKYTTISGGVEKDLNVIFNAIPKVFPTLGGYITNQWTESASIYGKNAIIGLYGGVGTYYSTNYGKNYAQSTGISGTIGSEVINGVSLYGLRAIANSSKNIFYSSNAGQSWTSVPPQNLPGAESTRNYQGCAIYDNLAIVTATQNYIAVSNNYGVTWEIIVSVISGSFKTPSISYDPVGAKYIAVCTTINNGMWFCTNFTGVSSTSTFTKSASLINSNCVSLVGLKGISGAGDSGGMYFTTNGGQTWAKATDASGTISSTTNIGTYNCGLSANGVGIARGTNNVYYVTKNFGQSWANTSSTAYGAVAIHNGNAITLPGNYSSIAYYGKISL